MRHVVICSAVLFAFVAVGCGAQSGEDDSATGEANLIESTSAYTSLLEDNCRWSEYNDESLSAEAYCPGMHGFDLRLSSGDERIMPSVVSDGARYVPLHVEKLPFFGGFSRLGDKAEWRGRGLAIGQVDPYALIFRYFVSGPDGGEKNWLVVARIEKNNACIIDTVSGALPNHNVKAREIADANRAFVCPPPCGILNAGGVIKTNESIASCNGAYSLTMQGDGNVVLYEKETGAAKWHSHTNGTDGQNAIMQEDGNFVVYGKTNNAVWSSRTSQKGSWLEVTNDGRVGVFGPGESGAMWQSTD